MNAKEYLKAKGIHPTEPIYWDLENKRISLDELMEEYAEQQVKNLNKPAVIKSAFKCDDVELQPIECVKWRGCFDCPHYKAVL